MPDPPSHTLDSLGPSTNSPLSYLWIPDFPEYDDLFVDSIQPARAPTFAVANVDFGGPNGEYLNSLTRITLHKVSNEVPIIGMEFFYTNRSLKFGVGGETELSFTIDGPGGERIVDVEIVVDDPECDFMRGIQVRTTSPKYHCTILHDIVSSYQQITVVACDLLPCVMILPQQSN